MSLQPYCGFEAPGGLKNLEERQKRKALLLASLSEGLPTLPGYVFELNSLLSVTPVDLKRVSQVIRTDPSLGAQVIRLCNSALLDLRGRVFNIEEAVVLLGTERLRALVLTCSLLEHTGQGLSTSDVQAFWQHSFLSALLSERIARWIAYSQPGQAYLAGPLHDIGILPLLMVSCSENWKYEARGLADSGESMAAEREHFGLDHCEMGRWIGISWDFPPALIEVFEHHHQPQEGSHDPHLVGVVSAADQFCQRHGVMLGGTPRHLESTDRMQYDEALRTCLPQLGSEDRTRLTDALETEFQHWIQSLEFDSLRIVGRAAAAR